MSENAARAARADGRRERHHRDRRAACGSSPTAGCRSCRTSASSSATTRCSSSTRRWGPANGARVLAAARGEGQGKRLLLTITHFHPEHGFGAQVFRDEATIVYNRAQRDELHDKGAGYVEMFRTFGPAVAAALEGVELVDPHDVYERRDRARPRRPDRAAPDVGRRPHARATRSSSSPEERILFAGDLVEARIFPIYPYFPPDDADVDGSRWIEVLRRLEELDPAVVVPGHGAVGDVSVITAAREYHELLREETFGLAAEGRDADEVVARGSSPNSRPAIPTGSSPSGSASASAPSTLARTAERDRTALTRPLRAVVRSSAIPDGAPRRRHRPTKEDLADPSSGVHPRGARVRRPLLGAVGCGGADDDSASDTSRPRRAAATRLRARRAPSRRATRVSSPSCRPRSKRRSRRPAAARSASRTRSPRTSSSASCRRR